MPWLNIIIALLIGLIVGSFLNVVIHRGPALWRLVDGDARQGNLAFPGSYCPTCKTPLRVWHLIPVFSFILLGGKCATCKAPINIRYPLVEILGAAASLFAYFAFGPTIAAFLAAILIWFLIALGAIDLETGYLPDVLTLPLIAIGLAANVADIFTPFVSALIGAGAGYLIFRIIGAIFLRLRGIEGLGQGDAKLLAALGAWLGWQVLAPTVLIASVLALTAIFMARLNGKPLPAQTPIPFGPALATAGVIIFLGAAIFP